MPTENQDSIFKSLIQAESMKAAYDNENRLAKPEYHEYLKDLFNDYLTQLAQLEQLGRAWDKFPFGPESSITFSDMVLKSKAIAEKIIACINGALEDYLDGNLYTSTSIFNTEMNKVFPYLNELRVLHADNCERWSRFSFVLGMCHREQYRVRKLREDNVSVNNMRHPPFSKREHIDTQRFSIPGYPCLYLGSSLYVCVKEVCNLPADISAEKKPYFSLFWWQRHQENHARLLELFLIPEHFDNYWKDLHQLETSQDQDAIVHRKFIHSYLACWPLQLACSIPVKHRGGKFREEYIIPQLLMMWLKNQNHQGAEVGRFHGICYRSTRIPASFSTKAPHFFLNYAIPVMTKNCDEDYCDKLGKLFEITVPKPVFANESEEQLFDLCEKRENQIKEHFHTKNVGPDPQFVSLEFVSYLDDDLATTAAL